VAIRSSSARDIDALITDLASERAVVRETALARLMAYARPRVLRQSRQRARQQRI